MTLKQEDFDKVERYAKGEINDNERAYVESLFTDGENNTLLRQSLEKEWNSHHPNEMINGSDLTYILDRIHHRLRNTEYKKEQKPIRKFIRAYSKIAATLLIPIIVASLSVISYVSHRYKITNNELLATVFAPKGSRVTFILPDGTKGVLNSGSKLSYTIPFNEQRNLKLEGEAWFEVKHDTIHPMLIKAGNSTVKVVGTSFNLSSYPDED